MSEHKNDRFPQQQDSAETVQESYEVTSSQDNTSSKKTLRNRVLLIVGIVILAILLILGGTVLAALRQLRGDETVPIVERESAYSIPEPEESIIPLTPEELETMTESLETEPLPDETATEAAPVEAKPIYKQEKKDPDVTNVLLLGRDSRNAAVEYGRTDTMIILSYNKRTHEVKLISLLRDMLVYIEGQDYNRINTAFAFGGIGLCINTINDTFQLDIQDYMTIDFTGLVSVIDAIGGIDVNLTADEVALYKLYGMLDESAQAGMTHFTGEQALSHARNRALGSDFERTRRQRDILMAIFTKVTTSMSLTEVTSLVNSVLKIVKTNLPTATILSLATDVMTYKNDITFNNARLPFDGT